MPVEVVHIADSARLQMAWKVRFDVFVEEQGVPAEEELDRHEGDCRHFLALGPDGAPVGAARWRFTDKGVKLERFAVLKHVRGRGVGSALLEAVLEDIRQHPQYKGHMLYLHAQLDAIPLYTKFGFTETGGLFEECDILHRKMVRDAP